MKSICLPGGVASLLIVIVAAASAVAAENFAGEWADRNYHGNSVFQLSLEQKGSEVSISFSAAQNDGSGAAPEADGKGKVPDKGIVEFTWEDSFRNSGTGTIKKAGKDVLVSIKATHVEDPRCLQFYGDKIRLKPVSKK